jgi:transcription elongation factor Elf1
MICNSCHTENKEYRLFCSNCGKALSTTRHLCGFINETGDLYCGGCGLQIKANKEEISEKMDEIFSEKFSSDDIEEILREENLLNKPKTTIMSQDEIDKLFKKS